MRTTFGAQKHCALVVEGLIVICSLATLGFYLHVAVPSLTYPFGLEWMEGGTMDVVHRVVDGQPLYVPPSIEYVPYIYPPFYYYLAAALSSIFGGGFFAARLLSLASTLIAAALIGLFVHRETLKLNAAVVSAALYLGSYEACGRWFHLARVDSLYIVLILAVIVLLRANGGVRTDLAAAMLIVCATFTKQTAAVALLPLGVYLAVWSRKQAVRVGVVVFGVLLAVGAGFESHSAGWFSYYVLTVPRGHSVHVPAWLGFWINDLRVAWPMLGLTLFYGAFNRGRGSSGDGFFVAMLIGFVGSAWMSRLHSGGAENTLMSAFAGLAISCGLAFGRAREIPSPWGGPVTFFATKACILAQLALLSIPPPAGRPDASQVRRGMQFLNYLASVQGEIFMPDHRFVQTTVGKSSFGYGMAAADVLRTKADHPAKHILRESVRRAFIERRFSQVILTSQRGWIAELTKQHYCFFKRTDLAPSPTTGTPHKPRWIWVRKGAPQCPKRSPKA